MDRSLQRDAYYVDPYDVDRLNPKEELAASMLWDAIPHGDRNVKPKAQVYKRYGKGFEGLFASLPYCLKYGDKDDQVKISTVALFSSDFGVTTHP